MVSETTNSIVGREEQNTPVNSLLVIPEDIVRSNVLYQNIERSEPVSPTLGANSYTYTSGE